MKKSFTILVFASMCISTLAVAQRASRWEIGIQGEYGRDWYHKTYAREIFYEGSITDFSSSRSWGTGIYFEKPLNPKFSMIGQLGYAVKKVHPEIFHTYNNTASQHYLSEVHHRGAVDAGLRWYLNPGSKVRFFAEGKLGANVFISAVQQEQRFGRIVRSDVFGFERVAPVASGSLGLKWSRLTVSAEYRQDLITSKRYDGRTGIDGKGVFGKVGFALLRGK
ncbi:hypothetical protein [Dyadobacter sp. CY323]|uniref:hypothetical protein n=1 Tax=Dyadobacter sp. CY323 TaxID=2907302 RepID=UPI001F36D2C6|nr:hypothetical protein [Dyadobacter sp. CY323]MCE6988289.1 hypothetical protein [Dyadobacter sp. CY323]